ncbi:MAG: hypothetical protein Q4E16_04065 [Neisseria sp.]|nr:hypothetical protein [Neisseria sp.]
MADDKQPAELENAEQSEQKRKSKAKIRTIRLWLWVIALLFAGVFFLSQCAMTKPQFKAKAVESCIKNVPFAEKWQNDMKNAGLNASDEKHIADYCLCMWEKPLDKLNPKQIESFSSLSPQEQLDLLGGAAAFEARDKQCVADLKKS